MEDDNRDIADMALEDDTWLYSLNCRQYVNLIEIQFDEFVAIYDAMPNKAELYKEAEAVDEDFIYCLVGEEREAGLAGSAFNGMTAEKVRLTEEWFRKNFREYFYKHRVECSKQIAYL